MVVTFWDSLTKRSCIFWLITLRRPPDAGKGEKGSRLLVGLVVGANVELHETVEVQQAHRDVGTVSLVAGLLGKAARGHVEPAVAGAKAADERANLRGAMNKLLKGY